MFNINQLINHYTKRELFGRKIFWLLRFVVLGSNYRKCVCVVKYSARTIRCFQSMYALRIIFHQIIWRVHNVGTKLCVLGIVTKERVYKSVQKKD